jgi:hypothetical protein
MLEEINKTFPKRPKTVIYAFGDTIYNPGNHPLSQALIAHESVHGRRQLALGPHPGSTTQWSGPELWWRRYLEDKQFRFDEEVHAHAAEVLAQMPKDRNQRTFLMCVTINRLLAPFYEYGNTITRKDADTAMRKALKDIFTC